MCAAGTQAVGNWLARSVALVLPFEKEPTVNPQQSTAPGVSPDALSGMFQTIGDLRKGDQLTHCAIDCHDRGEYIFQS